MSRSSEESRLFTNSDSTVYSLILRTTAPTHQVLFQLLNFASVIASGLRVIKDMDCSQTLNHPSWVCSSAFPFCHHSSVPHPQRLIGTLHTVFTNGRRLRISRYLDIFRKSTTVHQIHGGPDAMDTRRTFQRVFCYKLIFTVDFHLRTRFEP